MRLRLSAVILLAGCCLAFSPEAKANRIYGNTGVYYDPVLNKMVGYAETSSNYSAGMYYCTTATVLFQQAGGQAVSNYAWDGCQGGYSRADALLPYDPNAEYIVESEHEGEPYYRDQFGQMVDYYNFQVYLDGIPVRYPGTYDFIGPGPRRPSVGSILLGITTALFSQGTQHGNPHHLKVVSDNTALIDCGRAVRTIRFKVVDSTGRSAGKTFIRELFDQHIVDSCTGVAVQPGACSDSYTGNSGEFNDRISVGCPLPPQPCGFLILPNRWQWCARNRPVVTLATMNYDARKTSVHVAGTLQFTPGTQIFP